jgi:sulfide dehydrogenase cytochrome subunit
MPIIGGLAKEYLYTVLSEYKSGERDATIMDRIARGYSDPELKAIASYFAAKPWVSSPFSADPKLVARGKTLHEKQCKTCHEDGGRVQEDDAPRLAGQWPEFTLLYLEECRSKGRRCQPRKMGSRVMKLSDEELKAMAHYYASEK